MFRGWELPKLMSMLVLLAVLGTVVFQARQPSTSQWFVADEATDAVADAPPANADSARPAKPAHNSPLPPAGEGRGVRAGRGETPAKQPAPALAAAGPTDEDPEQQADAAEEFLAVTDGTLGVQPEEMFAYWRLIYWTENQSQETLRKRAATNLVLNDFMQSPGKHRGKLVRLDLNVRRVLAYDVDNSPFDIKRLYEIWGWTDESKAWLYCVVTAHLPEGMPIGPDVYERARFVGYFFKLQGYHEAGAKPRAAALRAPLLVGRLTRYPSLAERQAAGNDWWTVGVVAGLCSVLVGVGLVQYVHGRRSARRQVERQSQAADAARQWLQNGFPPEEQT